MSIDPQTVTAADLANPALDPLSLHAIAQARPDLWPLVVQHPNTYPALNAWIAQHQTPQVPPVPQPQPAADAAANVLPAFAPQATYVPQLQSVGAPVAYPAAPAVSAPAARVASKGSALWPVLLALLSFGVVAAAIIPAASSPTETRSIIDRLTEPPMFAAAGAFMLLLVPSIIAVVKRTRGWLIVSALAGLAAGGLAMATAVSNMIAATSNGWSLGAAFPVLTAVGVLAVVISIVMLTKLPARVPSVAASDNNLHN